MAHFDLRLQCKTLLWIAGIQTGLVQSKAEANPYLTLPLYAPVTNDAEFGTLAVLSGTIPTDLNGSFLRTGPNPAYAPVDRYSWFDGDGYVHAVDLNHGVASYRGAFIKTEKLKYERERGRARFTGLIQPVSLPNVWNYFRTGEPLPVTANTALIGWNGNILATHYSGATAYELSSHDLGVQKQFELGGLHSSMSAHPKIDPKSGRLVFISGNTPKRDYQWIEVGSDGSVNHRATFSLRKPFMMHDLAFTDNFGVVLDLPMLSIPAEPTISHVAADRSLSGRIGLIPRSSQAPVRWFDVAPGVVLHVVNAHEEGSMVVLRAIRFADHRLGGHLYEWRLDLNSGSVRETQLDERLSEFPRINNQFFGANARFAYVPGLDTSLPTFAFDRLVKHDLLTGKQTSYVFGKYRFGSEPVFVPRLGAVEEDDGYLLSLISLVDRGVNSNAELVILDAREMREQARIAIPTRVPYGFHATFVPKF
jgi:carotenoid cleavage dioxygenase-like enzyme